MPITMPASRQPEELSSGSSAGARRAIQIGAAATRIPASEDAMWRSPSVMSVNGAAIWIVASRAISGARFMSPPIAPRWSATGHRTSAASAVRAHTISAADMSRSPILMNR